MFWKLKRKTFLALILVCTLLFTVFSPIASAEENTQTMPDLSEYSYVTIDEIEPKTTVGDLLDNTVCSENEEIEIYNAEGLLLSNSDFVCNGATIIIFQNNTIYEVYKVRIYGDLNCDGKTNATDLVEIKSVLLGTTVPVDDTVADISIDGECNILDLLKIRKQLLELAEIEQNRMFSYTSRFNWLDNMKIPFSINGYEEIFEDFSIVSNDIDLTFNRYYDSNNIDSGIFGTGWKASFEGSCATAENNSKIVKIYGQQPLIFKVVDGEYKCEYSRASLTATDNGFLLVGEDGFTYIFNTNGHLVRISDKNNNTVVITVNTDGKIQKVTDSVGREYTYFYGENGLLSRITDCMQRTFNYTYDSSNRLSSVVGVMDTVTEQYEYNSNNKLIRVLDAFGNAISTISYQDDTGVVSSVTDSESITTNYEYNHNLNSVSLLQDNVIKEEYIYNRYNYLTKSNTEDGLQQNFFCNSYGDIVVAENADGSKVQYVYDNKGNTTKIITISEDETVTERNKYDSNNNLLSTVTDEQTTDYTYDENGNTLSVTKTDDENIEITEYTYTDNGLIQTVITDGVTTTYSYDNFGYLIFENCSDGTTKSSTYNSIGWVESETSEELTTYYKYNLNGDTLRETKNNVVKRRVVYDNYGRIKQQISEAEYNSEYDGLNLAQQTDTYLNNSSEVPVGVRYYYGENGKLSQIKASCYTVSTDSNQKVTSVTAGNTVLAEYNYTDDAKELLSSVNYANGQDISYNYDTEGNITSLYYDDVLAYTYVYDTEGTLTLKTNHIENIQTDYTEDSITVSRINEDSSLSEIYSYNSEKMVKLDLPVDTMGEEYIPAEDDEKPDLERITENFNNQAFSTDYLENLVKYGTVAYNTTKNEEDAVSNTVVKNYGSNLLSSSYEYDDNNLPIGLTHTFNGVKNTYSYTYDDNGNITDITRTFGYEDVFGPVQLPPDDFDEDTVILSGDYEERYYYDNIGQLIRVDDVKANQTVEYVYNGTSGNITAVKTYTLIEKDAELGTPLSTKTFDYAQSGWTDLLTSVDGNALTYDSLGNLLTYKGYTYTWEAGRRLTSISNDNNVYSYKYDDNGIRTQKTINGVTTYYTTVDGRITGQYDGTNTIYFRYNAENSLIGFNLNGTEYLYLKNIQGDIEGILDLGGNPVVEYTYDAWGKVLSVTGSMADTVGAINPMRYRDYYLDSETGYYYLQSRYYNPDFCRFINADEPSYIGTSGNSLGYNLFTYCLNNPIMNIDPFGKIPVRILYAVAGAALFGGVTYLIGRLIGISGKTLVVLTASLTAIGALAAAILGPKFLAKVAPKLAKWFQKVAKGTRILPKTYKKNGIKLSEGGIVILDAFKIMFHPPHIGKHNYFHIQIEVKIPGAKMKWKVLGRIPIYPTKWFK